MDYLIWKRANSLINIYPPKKPFTFYRASAFSETNTIKITLF